MKPEVAPPQTTRRNGSLQSARLRCKQTDYGVIPADWNTRALAEIGHCLIGLTYDPKNIHSDGVLVLRASNISDGALRFDDNVYVDTEIPARLLAREDDLLICVRNGSRPLIGKCALIDHRAVGMTFGAFMSVFRSPDNWFVFYCFQSDIVKHQIHEHLGATINQITNRSLNSFQIPYPGKEERDAIAEALSDVDELLGSLEKLIAKKRAIKQAAMQQLLTGKTRLPGFSGAWDVVRIDEHASIKTGAKNTQDGADDGEYPFFVRSQEVERIDTYSYDGEAVLTAGDGVGTGKVFHYINGRFDVHQRVYRISEFSKRLHGHYFFYQFSTMFYDRIMSMTAKSSVDSVRMEMIAGMQIPLPSPEEQQAIAAVLSDMDVEIAALKRRRDKTRTIKQGMMQQLLTGRVRLVSDQEVNDYGP